MVSLSLVLIVYSGSAPVTLSHIFGIFDNFLFVLFEICLVWKDARYFEFKTQA